MNKFFVIFSLLFVLLSGSLSSAGGLNCAQIWSLPQTMALPKLGLSLTYSPVVVLDSRTQSFPDHVLIETYQLGSKVPTSQTLRAYTNGITGIEAYGRSFLHEVGLQAIYQNYGARVPVETVQMVQRVESSLPLSRQALYVVTSKPGSTNTDDVKGLVRVFDGSIYHSGVRQIDNPALPLERILAKQSKSTTAVNQKRNEGADVFEIGKYFLDDKMNPAELKQVRKSILVWLMDYLESRGSESLSQSSFFVHVASRPHLLAYQRFFGFTKVSPALSHGLDENENILVISGSELYQNLKKITADDAS